MSAIRGICDKFVWRHYRRFHAFYQRAPKWLRKKCKSSSNDMTHYHLAHFRGICIIQNVHHILMGVGTSGNINKSERKSSWRSRDESLWMYSQSSITIERPSFVNITEITMKIHRDPFHFGLEKTMVSRSCSAKISRKYQYRIYYTEFKTCTLSMTLNWIYNVQCDIKVHGMYFIEKTGNILKWS